MRFQPRLGRILAAASENFVSIIDVENQVCRLKLQVGCRLSYAFFFFTWLYMSKLQKCQDHFLLSYSFLMSPLYISFSGQRFNLMILLATGLMDLIQPFSLSH
jgi:hypothetical protein